jgi:hypothetical protein
MIFTITFQNYQKNNTIMKSCRKEDEPQGEEVVKYGGYDIIR